MQQKIKLLFICFVFFSAYSFFGLHNFLEFKKVNNTQDFNFHFQQIQNYGKNYPPLYHFLFSFFSFNELQFYFINLFLICFIFPILLFVETKTWFSGLLYFALDLPHLIIHGATYPHLLVLIFFLIYLINRNLISFLFLIFLASITHKEGLILFITVFIAEIIQYVVELRLIEINLKNKYLSVGYIAGTTINNLKSGLIVFINALPLPIVYFAFNSIKKNSFYLTLIIFSFFGAITKDIRSLSIAQIILIISASTIIKEKPQKIKNAIIIFSFIQAIYFLLNYMPVTYKLIAFNI